MRKLIVVVIAALSVGVAFPQTTAKPKPKTAAKTAKPAEKPVPAAPTANEPQLPDQATVIAFYHRMFGFQENLNFKVAEIKWSPVPGIAQVTSVVSTPQGQQVSTIYITPDGKHAISGDMVPFGKDPFADNRELLKQAFGPVRGSPTPDVTLVEFADLECPACKAAEPTIDKLLADLPNARLVFQSFPLEQLHPWAKQAAEYLDCLNRTSNESALTFMEAVFTHQTEITPQNATEKLNNYVTMAKGDPAKVAACAATPQTAARLEKSIDLGKKLEITGTPTLFVNGRPISNLSNIPYDTLKALVQFEAAQK
jgi:protein-disulfide isomerase